MTLSELFSFLERIGRRPNRALSQNFLIDENVVENIVRTGEVAAGDAVLEIGPGPGALTSELLKAGAFVTAIEKDPIFSKELTRLQTPDGRLASTHADILKFDFSQLPAPMLVVANLPYHITTPILEKLISQRDRFTSLTLMVQSELANRISAQCGTSDYSSLSIFLQFHTVITTSFKVAAPCFYPKPKVDSKVLKLDWRPKLLDNSEPFFILVRRAFQQRRKMIRVSLQEHYKAAIVERALTSAGAKIDARPEALSLDQWLAFYKSL